MKMNSGRPGVDWDGAKEYARRAGIVGLGWGPADVPGDSPLEFVLDAIEREPGWAPTGPRMVRRLASDVHEKDLVWTRDRLGRYWLGRIEGPWRFDGRDEAYSWDLNNVRPCRWLAEPLRDFEIPGSVVRNFAGTGESLRRIKQQAATRITEMLWHRSTDPNWPWPALAPDEVITDLMDPIDVEDLVLLWLQAEGWLLLPSSRMHDTPVYEAALRHHDDGRLGVVSLKSGASSPVPIRALREAAQDAAAFAYSTHDAYTDPPADHGVVQIDRRTLVDFMAKRPELLPPRVTQWLRRPGPAA
jgi:hypothetical protein